MGIIIEVEFVNARENAMLDLLVKGMSIWLLGQQATIKNIRKANIEHSDLNELIKKNEDSYTEGFNDGIKYQKKEYEKSVR